eukprot:TRINITY_DN80111_c0_g1_i1.p1 TRINITY_DN80111_c0_g1~~TRINITY_DN80111_c0_g1_i1.p1  ORF type:complete len:471 (+),score=113.45 TRINITY_DN80111_c0_g1_i1:130-1542(+)
MDETRALLDALMGPNRNKKETGNAGEPEFVDRTICKNFLVGFCPHDWFTAKRQLRPCSKIHSEIMKEKFEVHSEADKYRVPWEEDFLMHLEGILRECESFIARERPKCRPKGQGKTLNMPPDAKTKFEDMEQRYATLIRKSEELADQAMIAESKSYMGQANTLKEEIDSLRARHTNEFPGEDVCEICGVKYLCPGEGALHDKQDHMRGRTHIGFAKIREKVHELRGKKKEWDKMKEAHKAWYKDRIRAEGKERESEKDRDGQREKDRDRQKQKDKDDDKRERARERSRDLKDRDRDKQREKNRRSRDRDRRRSRSRSRGKGRRKARSTSPSGSDSSRKRRADKDRRRSKDRDRGKEKDKAAREKAKASRTERSSDRSRSRGKAKKDKSSENQAVAEEKPPPEPAPPPPPPEPENIPLEKLEMPQLWAKIGKLPEAERTEILSGLPEDVKDRLEVWLISKVTKRQKKSAPA